MRTALRVVLWLVTAAATLALAGLVYLAVAYPRTQDPPSLTISATPELLARGEYLFHAVAACAVCHTPHAATPSGARVDSTKLGQGGPSFPLGDAGTLYAKNITPTALGSWSDGEVVRALRDGVSRDGSPLFPLMPYFNYRNMTERDLRAIVGYVRTLPARPDDVPDRHLSFPMNLIVRMMPGPAGSYPAASDPSNAVERGRYLVTVASCGDCHSPMDDRGRPIAGRELSGGNEFPTGDGWTARSANITPDSASGIGRWTRERFIGRFRHRGSDAGGRLTAMPWRSYGAMTEEDLAAIYAYLRTVPAVSNEVVRFAREPHGAP